MREDSAEDNRESAGPRRRALVNLAVALGLVAAVGTLRLWTNLADDAGLLAMIGGLALLGAALLFRSLLQR